MTLGHHFGSFGGPFWKVKSLILAPWGALGTSKKPEPKKSSKRSHPGHRTTSILEIILASFFDDFSIYFSVRFLDHFWKDFEDILGAKMELKSLENRFKIRSKFELDF